MTMSFRVTEGSMTAGVLAGLQRNQDQLSQLNQEISSGKQLTQPSDSPVGVASAMELRSALAANQSYSRSATDGLGRLGAAETALTSASTQLDQVQSLVLQGMSAPTSGSSTAMQALATQVDSVRQSLISLGNTTYLGQPVFGGTTSGTVAFDANGNYVGDDGQVMRRVSNGLQVRTDVPASAFGTGSSQLFSVLSTISNDMRTNPSALSGDLDQLKSGTTDLNTALTALGSRYSQIQAASSAADSQATTLTSRLSTVEDVDVAQASIELSTASLGYQAALAAAARVTQPSLLNFLQ